MCGRQLTGTLEQRWRQNSSFSDFPTILQEGGKRVKLLCGETLMRRVITAFSLFTCKARMPATGDTQLGPLDVTASSDMLELAR